MRFWKEAVVMATLVVLVAGGVLGAEPFRPVNARTYHFSGHVYEGVPPDTSTLVSGVRLQFYMTDQVWGEPGSVEEVGWWQTDPQGAFEFNYTGDWMVYFYVVLDSPERFDSVTASCESGRLAGDYVIELPNWPLEFTGINFWVTSDTQAVDQSQLLEALRDDPSPGSTTRILAQVVDGFELRGITIDPSALTPALQIDSETGALVLVAPMDRSVCDIVLCDACRSLDNALLLPDTDYEAGQTQVAWAEQPLPIALLAVTQGPDSSREKGGIFGLPNGFYLIEYQGAIRLPGPPLGDPRVPGPLLSLTPLEGEPFFLAGAAPDEDDMASVSPIHIPGPRAFLLGDAVNDDGLVSVIPIPIPGPERGEEAIALDFASPIPLPTPQIDEAGNFDWPWGLDIGDPSPVPIPGASVDDEGRFLSSFDYVIPIPIPGPEGGVVGSTEDAGLVFASPIILPCPKIGASGEILWPADLASVLPIPLPDPGSDVAGGVNESQGLAFFSPVVLLGARIDESGNVVWPIDPKSVYPIPIPTPAGLVFLSPVVLPGSRIDETGTASWPADLSSVYPIPIPAPAGDVGPDEFMGLASGVPILFPGMNYDSGWVDYPADLASVYPIPIPAPASNATDAGTLAFVSPVVLPGAWIDEDGNAVWPFDWAGVYPIPLPTPESGDPGLLAFAMPILLPGARCDNGWVDWPADLAFVMPVPIPGPETASDSDGYGLFSTLYGGDGRTPLDVSIPPPGLLWAFIDWDSPILSDDIDCTGPGPCAFSGGFSQDVAMVGPDEFASTGLAIGIGCLDAQGQLEQALLVGVSDAWTVGKEGTPLAEPEGCASITSEWDNPTSWEQASRQIGEQTVVEGPVVQVGQGSTGTIYLNVGRDWLDPEGFSIAIPADCAEAFDDGLDLEGQTVRVYGTIGTAENGAPMIELCDPGCLEVIPVVVPVTGPSVACPSTAIGHKTTTMTTPDGSFEVETCVTRSGGQDTYRYIVKNLTYSQGVLHLQPCGLCYFEVPTRGMTAISTSGPSGWIPQPWGSSKPFWSWVAPAGDHGILPGTSATFTVVVAGPTTPETVWGDVTSCPCTLSNIISLDMFLDDRDLYMVDLLAPKVELAVATPQAGTAVCDLSQRNLSFGQVEIGAIKDKTITITNSGDASLEGLIEVSNPAFSVDVVDYVIEAGEELRITVSFQPDRARFFDCDITLGGGCLKVHGTGWGVVPDVPEVPEEPEPTCPDVVVTSINACWYYPASEDCFVEADVTVKNQGSATATGVSVNLTASCACEGFKFDPGASGSVGTLTPGQSKTVTIQRYVCGGLTCDPNPEYPVSMTATASCNETECNEGNNSTSGIASSPCP